MHWAVHFVDSRLELHIRGVVLCETAIYKSTTDCRQGVSRISGRVPRYLAKLRGSPGWLPMYVLGRLMPVRKAHWLAAKAPPHPLSQPTMFVG